MCCCCSWLGRRRRWWLSIWLRTRAGVFFTRLAGAHNSQNIKLKLARQQQQQVAVKQDNNNDSKRRPNPFGRQHNSLLLLHKTCACANNRQPGELDSRLARVFLSLCLSWIILCKEPQLAFACTRVRCSSHLQNLADQKVNRKIDQKINGSDLVDLSRCPIIDNVW